jgi:phage tail tape-measure protein
MMERQSKSLVGIWRNIKDNFSNFQLEIANAGIFDLIKQKAEGVLTKLNGWAKDGTLKRWAETISDRIETMTEKAWTFIEDTNWAQVADGLGAIASGLLEVIGLIGKAAAEYGRWSAMAERANLQTTISSRLEAFDIGGVRMWGVTDEEQAAARKRMKQIDAPPAPVRKGSGFRSGQSPVKIGGAVDIRIKSDPGTKASVTRLSSNSKDVPVNVGTVGLG